MAEIKITSPQPTALSSCVKTTLNKFDVVVQYIANTITLAGPKTDEAKPATTTTTAFTITVKLYKGLEELDKKTKTVSASNTAATETFNMDAKGNQANVDIVATIFYGATALKSDSVNGLSLRALCPVPANDEPALKGMPTVEGTAARQIAIKLSFQPVSSFQYYYAIVERYKNMVYEAIELIKFATLQTPGNIYKATFDDPRKPHQVNTKFYAYFAFVSADGVLLEKTDKLEVSPSTV